MPYVTTADYIERFGTPEAISITDTAKTGAPDDQKIADAIADQSTYADAFLAARYAVPIANPPELLRKAVADLTREQLHTTRPKEAVTLAADRARTLLKDLSAGRAVLPAPSAGGDAPETAAVGLAVRSGDGRPRIFSAGNLADFTDLSGGGYGATVFDSGPRNW